MSKDKDNSIYSERLRAGKRRTYFFDVRSTKSEDYYITITESKRKFNDDGYERHKIFIYKEDFNKFIQALENTVNHVKDELMPDYNFEEFDRDPEQYYQPVTNNTPSSETVVEHSTQSSESHQVDYSDSEDDLSF